MSEVTTDLGTTNEGHVVGKTTVKVMKLGDGLSKAVDVQPVLVHAGDVVFFAVRAIKVSDEYDYEFDEDGDVKKTTLVQVFSALSAVFIDGGVVEGALKVMEDAIAEAAELRKTGQKKLPLCEVDHREAHFADPELTECPNCGTALPVEDPDDTFDADAGLDDGRDAIGADAQPDEADGGQVARPGESDVEDEGPFYNAAKCTYSVHGITCDLTRVDHEGVAHAFEVAGVATEVTE